MKNYIFDFADTIAKLAPTDYQILNQFFSQELNLKVSENTLNNAITLTKHLSFYSSVSMTTRESKKQFYIDYNTNLLKTLGILHLIDNPVKLVEYFQSFDRHWELTNDVLPLFKRIKESGAKLGIISNFDSHLIRLLNDLGVTNYLDYLYISETEGLEKPNVEFYKAYIKEFNLDVSATIYVGDNYILDYLPANQLGIKSLLLDEHHFFPKQDFIIDNLSDVLRFS